LAKGKLYLIPSLLGDSQVSNVLPNSIAKIIKNIDIYIVENIRSARRFIKSVYKDKDIDKTILYYHGKHDRLDIEKDFLTHIIDGKDVGIISENGLPCVADPGSDIVKYAHDYNIEVCPLVGPSSIFLALMASGLNGQNFVFHGYLPIEKKIREKFLSKILVNSRKLNQTQIFIETPYRNNSMFNSILNIGNQNTQLCIATNLTLNNENIKTRSIALWKKVDIDLHKKPTIFLLKDYI
jgi:16S rRNA (cytidine1402-2'-O)-methyltransferase|tara:strand:+ start:400 stop:1113 length:714 start_codon:yes stop_codon:yes gene_type:complete